MSTERSKPDLRRLVMEDLLRTGASTNMVVLVARLGRGRDDVLRALRALEALGKVTIEIGPKVWDNTTRERAYQAVPGATFEELPALPTRGRPKTPVKNLERIIAALEVRPTTCQEIADVSGVSVNHARAVLMEFIAQGRAVRKQGPPPTVGSVRSWIYEAVR